jgi:hypothetical protein
LIHSLISKLRRRYAPATFEYEQEYEVSPALRLRR